MQEIISICIVAYNNYDDIKNAIISIEKNTHISKIIYIVDNGSKFSSNESIISFKNFISVYNNIYYIDSGTNVGFGGGHNKVINLLDSKYHAIVNPDILLYEDALATIVDFMDKHQDIGMVIPRITDEQGNILKVYRKELTVFDMFIRMFCKNMFKKRQLKHTLQDNDYTKPFQVPFGQGSFLVIRTELFKELHGFDEGYFMYLEDADLCKRVNQISKLFFLPTATVVHKWEKGSHKNIKLFKYHLDSMKYYFNKWGWKLF